MSVTLTRGRLSKTVPAHRHTIEFNWIKRNFTVMCRAYREIRAKCGSPMDTCCWCDHKHVDGEMMALAQPQEPGSANKILCQECAELATADTEAKSDG